MSSNRRGAYQTTSRPLTEGEVAFLRRVCAGMALSQNEFATRAGLNKGHLSALLNRRVPCTRASLARIARAVGLDTIGILEEPL